MDILQSSQFYKSVYGWNIREYDEGSISFYGTVGQVSRMGVFSTEPATMPGLLISIMIDSVFDTLKLIVENNGKVV